MPRVRWVMPYGFCSKFRTLSSSAKWLKFDKVTESLKIRTFLRHRIYAMAEDSLSRVSRVSADKLRQQACWFLRPDCAPSSERPQFRMPPVRKRGMMRTQQFWIRTSVVDCHGTPPVLALHATIGGMLLEWQTSKCISSVSFVRIKSNFFTIHRRQTQKMMDQNFEIWILWFLRISWNFQRRRAVSLRPIWTIMVTAKLDQNRVLVTKFHQNRLTLKGRSAGQRHTDRQTDKLG